MIMTSRRGFLVFLAGLTAAAMGCSVLSGTGSDAGGGGGGTGAKLDDNLPEETHPGDYISYEGYFFAVLQVLDPAPGSADANLPPGMRDVALEIVVGNQSGDLFSPIRASFGGLSDGSGHMYGQMLGRSGSGIPVDLTGFLDRGERARGWMDFSVPEGTQPVSLEMSVNKPAGGWKAYSYGLTPPADGYKPVRAETSRKPPDAVAFGKTAGGKGCSLKVTDAEDNLDSIPSLFYTMPPNAKAVGVHFQIGGSKDAAAMIKEIALYDSDGNVYRMRGSEVIQGQGRMTVEAGETVRDVGYFVVPEGAQMSGIRLICNDMTNPMEDIVLRSALL
jgi:hypothetical protein